MLTLTVDAIHDYQVCELFYRYRYQDDTNEGVRTRYLMVDRFESTMKRVASFFFYKKQAGVTPSYNALLNRWEKLWFPKDMTAYDIAVEQRDTHHGGIVSYSNAAASILEQFHDFFAPDLRIPVIIDESFLVPLIRDVRLEGSFDVVMRNPLDGKFTVIKWDTRRARRDSVLNMAAQKIAFEHRNSGRTTTVNYQVFGLAKTGKPHKILQPSSEDIASMKYWATMIRDKDSFVPRRGWTMYCKGCPFDLPCSEFSEWPAPQEVQVG